MRRGRIFEDRKWLARVHKGSKDGPIMGTAFAIDSRHLLTCAHVVHSAGATGPGDSIWLNMLFDGRVPFAAKVLKEGWRPVPRPGEAITEGDTALLRIPEDEPDLIPIPITTTRPSSPIRISSYGFPTDRPESDIAEGLIGRPVGLDWLRIEQTGPAIIEGGFSGGAAWLDDVAGAIGMVVARNERDPRNAYIIPMEAIARDETITKTALASSPLAWLQHMTTALDGDWIDQTALIRERSEDFVGRNSVFEQIDEAISTEDFPNGYVFVEGEPGIGKSSILAHIAMQRGYPFHFNVLSQNLRSPRQFLKNICAQIITRFDLGRDVLPPNAGDDSTFLLRLLEEATTRSNDPVVILVDALDEAEPPPIPGVNKLHLPDRLPDRCFVIASNRWGVDCKVSTQRSPVLITLNEKSSENKADIEDYCRLIFARASNVGAAVLGPGPELEKVIATIWEKSEGNFMYVRTILPRLLGRGTTESDLISRLDDLPQGLLPYYEQHWTRMDVDQGERFRNLLEPIICFMAVAEEAVTARDIAGWMNASDQFMKTTDRTVEDVLKHQWGQFVNRGEEKPAKYSIYHRSFLEFLTRRVDMERYEVGIADALFKEFK